MTESTSRTNVSRRTIAKGAAWAVPAIAVASAAPAYAASRPAVATSVCNLFYGGGTINNQTHSIYLGVTSSTGVIPAGTRLTWTVSMSGSGNQVPTTNYSQNNIWTLSLSPASGTVATSFTATLTFNQDLTIGTGQWCAPALVWNDTFLIRPATTITVNTGGTVADSGSLATGGLTYTVAKRHPTSINQTGRAPHIYTTRTGAQTCWPSIQWSRLLSNNGYDNVTTYPSGTSVTAPCTWSSTSCTGTTGTSTPRASGPASGQYVTAQVC